jgi:hypothetical protein
MPLKLGAKIGIVAGLSIIVLGSLYFIFFPAIKPEKDTTAKDDEIKEKKYDPESFPLKKGMYGESIRKVRAVLGLAPTDIFDEELEDLLLLKFRVKEIRKLDYDAFAIGLNPNV